MNETTKQEFEEFINQLFKDNLTILVIDYEKTDVGVHIGLAAIYRYKYFQNNFQGNLTFHLNIFEEINEWEFKPSFDQVHTIMNIKNPLEFEDLEAKKISLPIVVNTIRKNQKLIREKMIEMNNHDKFND